MIQKLIVNADDFGLSEGVTIGILLAHQKGIVTSTTCMMNMPYAHFALKQAQKYPQLGVGVHLVLTAGRPLIAGAHSYTDENGNFRNRNTYPNRQPYADANELYQEWKAQIEKFIAITGHLPTHLDSHHHVHLLPQHLEVTKKLANEYHLPIRQRQPIIDTYEYIPCYDKMDEEDISLSYLYHIFESHEGSLELMCHPALIDQRLYDISSYSLPRMKELELLTSQDIKQYIQQHNIECIRFSDLKNS